MPSIESVDRNQYAVLWPYMGVDIYGEEQFGDPSEIQVRWIEKQRKVTDKQGNTTILDGQVIYYARVPLRSVMWLGTNTNPLLQYAALQIANTSNRGINRVEDVTYTEDIKGRSTRYELGLMRYRDVLLPIPITPTGLVAVGGASSITLTWGVAQYAQSYKVYRGDTPGGEVLYVNTVISPSLFDSPLPSNTTYYYKVTSVVGGIESGLSSEVMATTNP